MKTFLKDIWCRQVFFNYGHSLHATHLLAHEAHKNGIDLILRLVSSFVIHILPHKHPNTTEITGKPATEAG